MSKTPHDENKLVLTFGKENSIVNWLMYGIIKQITRMCIFFLYPLEN